jgi:DNA invertase Pin-like site-specific DNA recombinase
VSGNGISDLIMTVLAAIAQFERTLISERIKDTKRNLRRAGRHQGGRRPFGWRYGEAKGTGKARDLVPDAAEQAAIADIVAMREGGRTLMGIRDTMRERGFRISHHAIANILARQEGEAPAASGGQPSSAQRPWPAGWKDVTSEMLGQTQVIIGAPRPKKAGPAA